MKNVLALVTFLLLTAAYSDVWKKPPYIPDENHIPPEEIQREQEQEKRQAQEAKKHEKKHLRKESGSKGKIPLTAP